MAKAVFTASESSAYDDQIEVHYHFPKRYLSAVQRAVGDFIVYYEPRDSSGATKARGRLAYFAVARVTGIRPDLSRADHFYADLDQFLEFDSAVPFRSGMQFYESGLKKSDGTPNQGRFGWSVRTIPDDEFNAILKAGFSAPLEAWDTDKIGVQEEFPDYVERRVVEQVVRRPFRDIAFRRHVRSAYDNTCAVSGLRLINGGGRPEVQAAHIRPVEEGGPDTVRNGIALTGTIHWLFDRGLISFDDELRTLVSPLGVPAGLEKLVRPNQRLLLPERSGLQPHRKYLDWHRENRFKY